MTEPRLQATRPQPRSAERAVSSPSQRRSIERVRRAKRAYSVRRVDLSEVSGVVTDARPRSGDLVLARVKRLGQHQHLESGNGRRSRLWPGDEIIVAFGARYAPDQYEAVVPEDLSPCQLVAGGGIAARVVSRHARMKPATEIEPLGLLAAPKGVVNVRSAALGPSPPQRPALVVAVVGSSMNAGKTTTAANLVVGLRRRRLRVGAAKVTGTGAGGDAWLLTDAGASPVLDFTDSGFASTAGLPVDTLEHILTHLTGHIASTGVDCLVLEVADGLLQPETAALVQSRRFARTVDAVVFAAADAMSAVAGVERLRQWNLQVVAVSGLVTTSPLAREEAAREAGVPLVTIEQLATEETVCQLFPVVGRLALDGAVT